MVAHFCPKNPCPICNGSVDSLGVRYEKQQYDLDKSMLNDIAWLREERKQDTELISRASDLILKMSEKINTLNSIISQYKELEFAAWRFVEDYKLCKSSDLLKLKEDYHINEMSRILWNLD